MPLNLGEAEPAVSFGILDLRADFAERAALPRHRGRGQPPTRVARYARYGGRERRVVRWTMTGLAWQRVAASTLAAGVHQRNMRVEVVALGGASPNGVTVLAARALDDLARLNEQRH